MRFIIYNFILFDRNLGGGEMTRMPLILTDEADGVSLEDVIGTTLKHWGLNVSY